MMVISPKIQYCSNCGHHLLENAVFCDTCGFKIQDPQSAENRAFSPISRTTNINTNANASKFPPKMLIAIGAEHEILEQSDQKIVLQYRWKVKRESVPRVANVTRALIGFVILSISTTILTSLIYYVFIFTLLLAILSVVVVLATLIFKRKIALLLNKHQQLTTIDKEKKIIDIQKCLISDLGVIKAGSTARYQYPYTALITAKIVSVPFDSTMEPLQDLQLVLNTSQSISLYQGNNSETITTLEKTLNDFLNANYHPANSN